MPEKSYKKELVGYNAQEHTDLINFSPNHLLQVHNVFRHVNVKRKKIVDLGCGDGVLSRESIDRGARYVLGIDAYSDMITLAKKRSEDYRKRIRFHQAFVEDCKGDESFDIAILSYLLNNAKTEEQLRDQCRATASFLKKGGIAIIYNSNPFDTIGGDFPAVSYKKIVTGTKEGDLIKFDCRPKIKEIIKNYFLSPETHERAFSEAGFSKFEWKPLELWPGADQEYWHDYFNREHLPVIGMLAVK